MASSEDTEWRDRANAAEDELSALRKQLRTYIATLKRVERGGPTDFRRRIAGVLERMLDG